MATFKVGEYVHRTHWNAGKEYKVIDTRAGNQIRVQEDGSVSSWYSEIDFYAVLPKTKFQIDDRVKMLAGSRSYTVVGIRTIRREEEDKVTYSRYYRLNGRVGGILEDQLVKADPEYDRCIKTQYEIAMIAGCP